MLIDDEAVSISIRRIELVSSSIDIACCCLSTCNKTMADDIIDIILRKQKAISKNNEG